MSDKRYIIWLDRSSDDEVDGVDGRVQVARELQEAMEVSGLPVGTFDVVEVVNL